jgi:hypothetical protein
MARLAALTGDVDLGGRARRILAGFEPEGATLGTDAAAWGLAALEVAGIPAASRPP